MVAHHHRAVRRAAAPGKFAVHAESSYTGEMADRRLMMFMAKAALVIGVPVVLVIEAIMWMVG